MMPPEGHVDTDEADGLPDEQDSMMFSATDEGGQEEEHEQE